MEFLIEIEVRLPPQLTSEERAQLIAAERVRGEELAAQGILRAIWRVPGRFANRAIWSVPDATQLHEAIASLPSWPYLDVQVTPLAQHHLGPHCLGLPEGLAIEQKD
jgi:muconolactone D-isomerase